MKFITFSDTHDSVDFVNNVAGDKETILLLPGDIGEVRRFNKYRNMVEVLSSKFKEVLLVPGNHEYYRSNITKVHRVLKELDDSISNFHFLQNDFRIFDDVLILGGTLWTDYDNGNPVTKLQAQLGMNDYRCIRHGTPTEYWKRPFTPDDAEFFHHETKSFLKETLDKQREVCHNLKTVVMTHHAPSFASVDPIYVGDHLNGCYCSNMDYFVDSLNVDVWIHGHIHSSHDYMLGDTRVICNPRGYEFGTQHENGQFDSTFTFEV
ncbi:metallo-phosphoesterase [Pectobacterium phage vB_PcaM_CBB]|uniref:Metallophosphoesterase n=1 Tax=Pectobacterium phage vB_PcaM_CBB TaxID=2772511 RepID=A0A1L2CUI8_9CAUD|nr:metallo-phosphoesterase [Pectobacterium phage vB_PcaM_CBB]AMM43667.1 metallophosphoesterase [Pectobacterium phage vB_PcaM_CBB]